MGYAITTRYHGPTNYRGSRVIATGPAITSDDARAGRYTRATVGWDYGAGNGPALAETRPDGTCNVSGCYRSDRTHDPLAHREQDAQHDRLGYGGAYAGWGDSDANHRRAADAVVARLRAAGWNVSLAPEDRGASLPREDGNVYTLRYGAAPITMGADDYHDLTLCPECDADLTLPGATHAPDCALVSA